MHRILLVLLSSTIINAFPRQDKAKNVAPEPNPKLVYIIERLENGLDVAQQQQKPQQQQLEKQTISQNQRQSVSSDIPFGISYLEPQFQYPGFNILQDKQLFPRVQPQIVFYGPGGQGQPILINPGSPPGNFLVPHQPQPGPNVIIRDIPQRPVFVAGYPKPAHIPPIEKDAEEIPTNPAKIPPLASTPSARKPEKLETFNEGKFEYPTKFAGEADVLAAADRNPQLIPNTNLKPGHRFFILNGEDLFTSFPLQDNRELSLKNIPSQPEQIQLPLYKQSQIFDKQGETDLNNIPIQALLLRNGVTGQISNVQDLNTDEKPGNLVSLNQQGAEQALFRSNLPLNIDFENIQPLGQYRYNSPSEPYFAFNAEDIDNDSVVIDAKEDDGILYQGKAESDAANIEKDPEPSTAQAAPGAIALAGVGGVAAAAPKGTALVGKGGLAISSPQATAVAGPAKNDEKNKKPTKKN